MNDETFSGVPVIQSANSALASEMGCARKIRIGSDQAPELKTQQQEHQRRRDDQDTVSRLANDSCCGSVVAGQLPAVAGRELQTPRASHGARG